jgi:hypothetical protein
MHRFKYLVCAVALVAAGCSNSNDELTAPTTAASVTIDFTDATNGPLTPNGAQTFQFATLTAGEVSAELNALNPDGPNGAVVGLELGIEDTSGGCQSVVHNDHLQLASTIVAQATAAGSLCVRIYDASGTLPEPQTFDILVTHP